MRPIHLIPTGILMLALAACAPQAPSDADVEENAMASVVALITGYDSGGLVSTIAELPTDSLVSDVEQPLAVHASHRDDIRTLVSHRSGKRALGETRLHYGVAPIATPEYGAGRTVSLDIEGESLHASSTMAIRATTEGTISIAAAGPLLDRSLSGELRIDGDLGDTYEIPFTHVDATLTWTHLRLVHKESEALPSLIGEIAISIAARGERGLVLRNGALKLDGSARATLDVAGRRYIIDLRQARFSD